MSLSDLNSSSARISTNSLDLAPPASISSTTKEIKGTFDKCPRCGSQYGFLRNEDNVSSKVPLILTCKHTVCEDCIRWICLTNLPACPVCNEKFSVPHTCIDSLPEIFTPHFTLLGYLMWVKNARCRPIDRIPMKIENSRVEEKSGDGENDFQWQFSKCKQHSNSFLDVYCENCQRIVCSYCFLEYHKGHHPVLMYKLNDEETAELELLKDDLEVVLTELEKSEKKLREPKTYDSVNIETDIKTYFFEIHAKLHLAEQNVMEKLPSLIANEAEVVNRTLDGNMSKIRRILDFFKSNNYKTSRSQNMRSLYEEIQDLKNLPCRLVSSQGIFDSVIRLVCKSSFENIEESVDLDLKHSLCLENILVPIDDWSYQEERLEGIIDYP